MSNITYPAQYQVTKHDGSSYYVRVHSLRHRIALENFADERGYTVQRVESGKAHQCT